MSELEDSQAQGLLKTDLHVQATYLLTEALVASEKRMRRRIELLSEIVFETTSDGKLTFLNRAWSNILGYELTSSLNSALRDFVCEVDRPVLDRALAGDEGRYSSGWPQIRIRRADGRVLWMELAATALDEGGVVGALRDVTQRKLEQAEIAKLSLVASFTDNYVIITDGLGRIEWVNDAFIRKTGYSLHEALGRTPGSFLQGPGTDPITVERVQQLLLGADPFQFEILNYTKAGDEYWVSIHISPIRGSNGAVERYVSIQTDVSELRRTQQQLKSAKEVAETANEAKTQFLATISHEMRTPLNVILGNSEMALERVEDGTAKHFVSRINENAETLLGLISDLLDVSKIEAGQFDWERSEFNLSECFRQALVLASERAARKGLDVELNLDKSLPELLFGDPGRLRQIVANLTENAVKFTDRGFVRVNVSLIGGTLDIRVADSGAGISAEAQRHIFERFFQGDGSTTRRKGGAGLGLNIVKSLVQAAGGSVGVESAQGRGTEFRVLIPLGAPEPRPAENVARKVASGAAGYHFAAPAKVVRMCKDMGRSETAPGVALGSRAASAVLVAEDNEDNFAIVERHLLNAGYSVDRAANGKLALAAATARHYDLVLMDVEMPEMDGLEATREIRLFEEQKGRPPVPIVALTAHAVMGYRSLCLAAGCTGYLPKPIRKQALLDAVEEILQSQASR
jgi:hypothetical protein